MKSIGGTIHSNDAGILATAETLSCSALKLISGLLVSWYAADSTACNNGQRAAKPVGNCHELRAACAVLAVAT